MGRPKGIKNKNYSYEFKLRAMTDYFENHLSKQAVRDKYQISSGTFDLWKRNYLNGCLENGKLKKKGNIFAALHTSKSLTDQQRLELENMKLKIENERLKKGYQVKGGGADKEYVSIADVSMKSLKN
mgnify:CR=1 FL=1